MLKSARFLLALMLIPLPGAQVSRSAPGSASVEGVVVDRITGAPIAGAFVELDGIVNTRVEQRTTTTTRDGAFAFKNVPPSSYWLIASKSGSMPGDPRQYIPYVWGQRGLSGTGTQMALEAQQKIQNVRLELVPAGHISGRVLDSSGRPQAKQVVNLLRIDSANGSADEVRNVLGRWGPTDPSSAGGAKTNDRGEFRIDGVAPGQYYLGVDAFHADMPALDPSNITMYTKEKIEPTYFPGVTDWSKAAPIVLKAGTSVEGLDIPIRKFDFRTIHGMVVDDASGNLTPNASVLIIPVDAFQSRLANFQAIKHGTFEFHYVAPKTYYAFAYVENLKPSLFGRTRFEVGGQDIGNLTIRVKPGFALKGRIVMEGDAPPQIGRAPTSVVLQPEPPSNSGTFPGYIEPDFSPLHPNSILRSLPMPPGPPSPYILSIPRMEATFEDGGAFHFQNVMPWDYTIGAETELPNAFVKSVRLGNVDVLKEGIHLDAPPHEDLEIIISSGAGSLSGRVIGESSPVTDGFKVVLVPGDIHRRELYRTVWTDKSGRYRMEHIAPGDYTLYCWDFVRDNAWTDANFLRLYEGKGTPVHVAERSAQALEIHLIREWY